VRIDIETEELQDETWFYLSVNGGNDGGLSGTIDRSRPEDFSPGKWSRCLSRAPRPIGYIDELFVPPKKRGHQIGSRLVHAFMDIMSKGGVHWVFVLLVPHNQRDMSSFMRFFRRHGFVEAPECQDIDPGDPPSVLMKAEI